MGVIGIGIIGFGFMGRTHAEAYAADDRAHLVAIADAAPERVREQGQGGNIDGRGNAMALDDVTVYASPDELLADERVQAVSVCVPTPNHADVALAAMNAGRHVLVEKPLANTSAEAARVVDAARRQSSLVCMPAMCMRFWPGWSWLRETISTGRLGSVRTAHFNRLSPAPDWGGNFYRDSNLCGGAILDLHIHDADFIRACFGEPDTVCSHGASGESGGIDDVTTTYAYPDGPDLVVAHGGWVRGRSCPFRMEFLVNFEQATASFDSRRDTPLILHHHDHDEVIEADGTGYDLEIRHFLDLIESGNASEIVTIDDGRRSVELIEAEHRSLRTRTPVEFQPE